MTWETPFGLCARKIGLPPAENKAQLTFNSPVFINSIAIKIIKRCSDEWSWQVISEWAISASPISLLALMLVYCATVGLLLYALFMIASAVDHLQQNYNRRDKK